MGIKQPDTFYKEVHDKGLDTVRLFSTDDNVVSQSRFSSKFRQLSLFSYFSLLLLTVLFAGYFHPLVLGGLVAALSLCQWVLPKLTLKRSLRYLAYGSTLGLFTGLAPVLALPLISVQQLFILPLVLTTLSACACLLLASYLYCAISYVFALVSPFILFMVFNGHSLPLFWKVAWLVSLAFILIAVRLRQKPEAPASENGSRLSNDLKDALENNALGVYYQPRYCLEKKTITKVEALVRWQHTDFGFIPPVHIIALAEQTGLIHQLGDLVIRKACKDASDWQKQGFDVGVSVNLSTMQLTESERLIARIKSCLYDTGICTGSLELELTESVLIEQFDEAVETLHAIKKLGLEVSIDDFGTGYSSLCYLKNLPADSLKVDRSFISDLTRCNKSQTILQSIISMAHQLDLRVVAEGVEDQAAAEILKRFKCDEIQGHLISPPIPVEELINTLSKLNR